MEPRAQVFISCGQREDLNEIEVAERIAEALHEEGFEPYIAVKQQTLRGLTENIFERLAASEYFLFIDFKREQLLGSKPLLFRGSVFTQQELAIASYLDIDVIAFQEEGVSSREGIMSLMQANCERFSDRTNLPMRVIEEIKKRQWSSSWKNAISIDNDIRIHNNVLRKPENVKGDFYHLIVKNNHRHKTARNVYGYLESVINIKTGMPVHYEVVEFKWAGYTLPNATIPAQHSRKLDAFWIPHLKPNMPQFNVFTDSSEFVPRLSGPGEWQLVYSVISDTVPGSTKKFRLKVGESINQVEIGAV